MALACVCIGTYGVVKAQDAIDAQTKVSGPLEMSVEAAIPGVVMPSPVHVFTTVKEAGGVYEYYTTDAKVVTCRL